MKVDNTKVFKRKQQQKLRIEDIKKNSSSDVSHTIKRIKEDEYKIVIVFVVAILFTLGLSGYFIILAIRGSNVDVSKSGPLLIEFKENLSGMKDIISFTEENANPTLDDYTIVATEFSVTNDSKDSSRYVVYLEDYIDMIDYDKCQNKKIDYKNIMFSVDEGVPGSLFDVFMNDKYIIFEGEILPNDTRNHKLEMWHMDYSDDHYHGKVVVEILK